MQEPMRLSRFSALVLPLITEAHAETKVEPNAVRDDLGRKPMASVRLSDSNLACHSGEGQRENALPSLKRDHLPPPDIGEVDRKR